MTWSYTHNIYTDDYISLSEISYISENCIIISWNYIGLKIWIKKKHK